MAGCQPKEQMASFIPTKTPEQDYETQPDKENGEDEDQEAEEATPTPKELHVGQTTSMYVKLDTYGGFLNIRPMPSTDGEPVGLLVHAEKVDVIEITDGWASIARNGEICYVNADYLVKERPAYLEPPTATPSPTPEPPTATPSPTPKPPTATSIPTTEPEITPDI